MNDLDARLTTCFVNAFPALDPAAASSATSDTMPDWDSMASITLMTLVQEEFGVDLDLERMEDFNSYEKLRSWLAANG